MRSFKVLQRPLRAINGALRCNADQAAAPHIRLIQTFPDILTCFPVAASALPMLSKCIFLSGKNRNEISIKAIFGKNIPTLAQSGWPAIAFRKPRGRRLIPFAAFLDRPFPGVVIDMDEAHLQQHAERRKGRFRPFCNPSPCGRRSVFFDGNTTLADLYLDPGRFRFLLIDINAEPDHHDRESSNDEIEATSVHSLPPFLQ
ncbi:hypothetical protein LH464_17620 [Neorhizobium sp. T786]|uniref:hypothetical protein n=1 Tax=Pseudorhizobium xiangyangii TaxID=2883104 RepID=UPI001CFFB987|nr:hypothetical protein [Neorhizobium xiangyangii]MCB5204289.1 hypothetical protein [Neorhizobium xiangyangii]